MSLSCSRSWRRPWGRPARPPFKGSDQASVYTFTPPSWYRVSGLRLSFPVIQHKPEMWPR